MGKFAAGVPEMHPSLEHHKILPRAEDTLQKRAPCKLPIQGLLAGVLSHDPASLLEASVTEAALGQQGTALFSEGQP